MSEPGSSSAASAPIDAPSAPQPFHAIPASSDDLVLRPGRGLRAGTAVKSLLTMICGSAMLLTAAAVLDPATLQARSVGPAPVAPPHDLHQEFARSLAAFLGQCRQVLAVNDHNHGVGAEIVLWLDDNHDPGRINADELAVVSHSPLFQSVTVYLAATTGVATRSAQQEWRGVLPGSSQATARQPVPFEAVTYSEADLTSPGAIERWRAHTAVTARVVGTGLSSMVLEAPRSPQSPARVGDRQLSLFRLTLTWNADSSDGAQSASALVEAG